MRTEKGERTTAEPPLLGTFLAEVHEAMGKDKTPAKDEDTKKRKKAMEESDQDNSPKKSKAELEEYNQRATLVSVIAVPLATFKLNKKVRKLVQKGSFRRASR